jgi:hypothetical protein
VTEGHSDEDLKLGGTPERKRGAIRKHCYWDVELSGFGARLNVEVKEQEEASVSGPQGCHLFLYVT